MLDSAPWLTDARADIGHYHDGPDVPMLARQVAEAFPDMPGFAEYCAQAGPTTAWCGIYVAAKLAKYGIPPPFVRGDELHSFMWVDSWVPWGELVLGGREEPGDIAIFLGDPHHVTFVAGDGKYIGGNQSDGVTEASYRRPNMIRRAIWDGHIAKPDPVASTGKRFTNITATVFGGSGDPNYSAYDDEHFITDTEFGTSLPARLPASKRRVRIFANGKSIVANVVDVGPWNTTDFYWDGSGVPRVISQKANGERADNGRVPTNDAAIDLTPAVARYLGIDGKGKVDWEFATDDLPPPPPPSPKEPDDVDPPDLAAIRRDLDDLKSMMEKVMQQQLQPQSPPQFTQEFFDRLAATIEARQPSPPPRQPGIVDLLGPLMSKTNLGIGGVVLTLLGSLYTKTPLDSDFILTLLTLFGGLGGVGLGDKLRKVNDATKQATAALDKVLANLPKQ